MRSRIFALFFLIGSTFLIYEYLSLPDVSILKTKNPKTTFLMEMRDEEFSREGKRPAKSQVWVPIKRISPYLVRAVIISEDANFYWHNGYDIDEIKESVKKNWDKKRFTRGGSTITQQLVKNLYLSPSKTPWRKVKEFVIARRIEETLTKKRILELYLNLIEWGDGIYGIEAASRHYFDKSSSDLMPEEAALLAAIIPNAREFDRKFNIDHLPDKIAWKKRWILNKMDGWTPTSLSSRAQHLLQGSQDQRPPDPQQQESFPEIRYPQVSPAVGWLP